MKGCTENVMNNNSSREKRTNLQAIILAITCLAPALQTGCAGAGKADNKETAMSAKPAGEIIRRKDAFFGLHFDLHPGKNDTSLGADTAEENVAALLDRVKPDYVQYDCKGHAGYTGYPTKIGWPSPGIVKDALAVWRKVTKERGVGLFIHYSGVWDAVAMEHHPEWARVDENGKPDGGISSTFGPYVDKLLIPQLIEVTDSYALDGVWVDGECWAAKLDYCPAALEQWRSETGYQEAPKKRDDPRWLEWKMFHRRQFEKYLAHWVDALHAHNPKLQITSNWMGTTIAPVPVKANLDYLSGDYSPMVSADRARVDARYMASVGMPWDLMAWGFNWNGDLGQAMKTAPHLQQEAAVVLMQGGGFQIYYQPTRSGYVAQEIIDVTGKVADFCRARQSFSHKSGTVPQVALLMSTETQWDRSDNVFSPGGCHDELEGALHALLELHYSVDILAEHQLQPRLAEFPLVVIPDSYKLADDFRAALLQYVANGGSLMLLGERCARLFDSALGVQLEGEPQHVAAEVATPRGVVSMNAKWQKVTPKNVLTTVMRHPTRDSRKDGEVAATVAAHGKGRIAAVYGPISLAYFRCHHPGLREMIGGLAEQLFPNPMLKVNAPATVDASLRRAADGRLTVHLLNLTEAQRSDRFLHTDFIPKVGPIGIELRMPKKPASVTWEPRGVKPAWSWKDGVLSATIPELEIHGALVVDER